MGSFQERIGRFLDEGLKEGLLSLEDYNSVMNLLEEAGKITTIHPELYAGLLKDSLEVLPKITAETEKELSRLKKALKLKGFKTFDVTANEDLWLGATWIWRFKLPNANWNAKSSLHQCYGSEGENIPDNS